MKMRLESIGNEKELKAHVDALRSEVEVAAHSHRSVSPRPIDGREQSCVRRSLSVRVLAAAGSHCRDSARTIAQTGHICIRTGRIASGLATSASGLATSASGLSTLCIGTMTALRPPSPHLQCAADVRRIATRAC